MYYSLIVIIVFLGASSIGLYLSYIQKDRELTILKKHISEVELTGENLRYFRHDYVNIMTGMGIYIENNDMEGLKDFYKKVLKESMPIMSMETSISYTRYIKIDALKFLVISKIMEASNLGIEVSLAILEPIENLNINEVDLCRIVGIILDNAIEGAAKSQEKWIKFGIIINERSYSIVTKNSCAKEVPPIYELRRKNFSTKGKHRGLGLGIIDKIVNTKYANITSNIEVKDRTFIYDLNISN